MTQVTDGDIFWVVGISGSILGIVLNSYLIASLISKWNRFPFACLFTATAAFDLFFSLIEILTQHQVAIKSGVMFILPRGIEWLIKDHPFLIELVFLLHCMVCMNAIFILPALYQYHYVFVKNGQELVFKYGYIIQIQINPDFSCRTPKKSILFRNLLLTLSLAFIVAFSASLGINESMERGRQHYLKMFDDNWFHENERFFLYACDIQDLGTVGYFAGGLTITTLSIAFTSYYAFKARIQTHIDDMENQHQRTKIPFTRTQFTRALIMRTFNTWIFCLLPVSLVTIAMIFRFDIEVLGDLVMSPWCFLPAANAVATLFIIRK